MTYHLEIIDEDMLAVLRVFEEQRKIVLRNLEKEDSVGDPKPVPARSWHGILKDPSPEFEEYFTNVRSEWDRDI